MSCHINAEMKLCSPKKKSKDSFFLFYNRRGVIPGWNLWDVFSCCSSNLVSLILQWFTISMIQQPGRGSSPLIWSGTTHISTQYLSKHVAFTHSFLLLSLSSSSYQPYLHHRLLSPPQASGTDTKLTVRDRNTLSTRSYRLMSENVDEMKT